MAHDKLKRQYCDDWLKTDEPWLLWEYSAGRDFTKCHRAERHLLFQDDLWYRRIPDKPLTIEIRLPLAVRYIGKDAGGPIYAYESCPPFSGLVNRLHELFHEGQLDNYPWNRGHFKRIGDTDTFEEVVL